MHNTHKENMKALLYPYNSDPQVITIDTFTEAQECVCGIVEIQYKGQDQMFLFNEEGRVMGLPTNPHYPQFVGNVLVVNRKQFDNLPFGIQGV
jgi:hypothetical protein